MIAGFSGAIKLCSGHNASKQNISNLREFNLI